MNYYAVLPNYRQSSVQALHPSNTLPHPNHNIFASTPSVLLILSQALKSSIAQYSAFYPQQKVEIDLEKSNATVKDEKNKEKSSMELE